MFTVTDSVGCSESFGSVAAVVQDLSETAGGEYIAEVLQWALNSDAKALVITNGLDTADSWTKLI